MGSYVLIMQDESLGKIKSKPLLLTMVTLMISQFTKNQKRTLEYLVVFLFHLA